MNNLITDYDKLKQLLKERSIQAGHFILSSGKTSNIYIDARLTTMSSRGMILIGSLGFSRIISEGWHPDAVGGLTMGADPVAYAISHTSALRGVPLDVFSVRKQAKDHGTTSRIEGPFTAGDSVVIVEDVITTGQSALAAISAVENAGGIIEGVLAIIDRKDGGIEAIVSRGYKAVSLTTIEELLH